MKDTLCFADVSLSALINIYWFYAAAPIIQWHQINWVTDATASKNRTTSTNQPTAASRGSQVLQVSAHTQETYCGFLTAGNWINRSLPSLPAALDGVPFSLSPNFDGQANGTVSLTFFWSRFISWCMRFPPELLTWTCINISYSYYISFSLRLFS